MARPKQHNKVGGPKPEHNHLLGALPTGTWAWLFPSPDLISLSLGLSLYESGDTLRPVYFLIGSIIVMGSRASCCISGLVSQSMGEPLFESFSDRDSGCRCSMEG